MPEVIVILFLFAAVWVLYFIQYGAKAATISTASIAVFGLLITWLTAIIGQIVIIIAVFAVAIALILLLRLGR